MSDFFERKKILKPSFGDFDLTKESDLEACGLEKNGISFKTRNESFFKTLEKAANIQNSNNPVGSVAKQLEEHFSTREMSFLLAKTMLVKSLQEQQQANAREAVIAKRSAKGK